MARYPSAYGRKKSGVFRQFLVFLIVVGVIGGGVYYLTKEDNPVPDVTETPDNTDVNTSMDSAVTTGTEKPLVIAKKLTPKEEEKFKSDCKLAESLYANDDFVKARATVLSYITMFPEGSSRWNKVAIILTKANDGIFNSSIPFKDKKILYTVVSGDSLAKIAKKFKSTVEAIQRGNGMSSDQSMIHIGETLSIYKGNWSIKISKPHFTLCLYDEGQFFKMYKVGLGRQNRTPVGTFEIVDKVKNPDWYSKGEKILYGDPQNPLGSRWMRIAPTGKTSKHHRGYGIHGTIDPNSIGKLESNGCIRMRKNDVEELYSMLPFRTPVVIEE